MGGCFGSKKNEFFINNLLKDLNNDNNTENIDTYYNYKDYECCTNKVFLIIITVMIIVGCIVTIIVTNV